MTTKVTGVNVGDLFKSKKTDDLASPFSQEFSSLARGLRRLTPAGEKAAVIRNKIYDLLSAAVLGNDAKDLTAEELDLIFEFLRQDTSFAGNGQFSRAMEVLERFAQKENVQALVMLADIYSCKYMQPPAAYRKTARAIIQYEKAASTQDAYYAGYAHSRLAGIYANCAARVDDENDKNKHTAVALKHAELSAGDCNSPYGQVLLGCWYYDPLIVGQDFNKCHDLLLRAYNIVKIRAWNDCWIKWETYFHFGFILFHGRGCTADPALGEKLLREAAEHGNADAANWLARNDGERKEAAAKDAGNVAVKDTNPMGAFTKHKKNRRKVKSKKDLDKMLKPLHAMIGCAPVKREIESLIYLAHANALRLQKKIDTVPPSLHAAFLGSPGTGKTTIARMYGQLLHQMGYLTGGQVVEASRGDLVGEYIGSTTPKVRALVEKAVGGVLFIDEAYSLVPEEGASWDFGSEAIAELIQQMENRRNNLVVVFAGYTEEMKMFLRCNPGLRSRVPNTIEFPDYKADEMVQIFEKFCEEASFTVTPDALAPLGGYLKKLDRESVRRMGNARGVRNIFEDSLMRQARRIVREGKTSKKALMTIEAQDILLPNDPGKGILTVIKGGGL